MSAYPPPSDLVRAKRVLVVSGLLVLLVVAVDVIALVTRTPLLFFVSLAFAIVSIIVALMSLRRLRRPRPDWDWGHP